VTVTECALLTLNLTSSSDLSTSNLALISSLWRILLAKSFEYQLDRLMQRVKVGHLLSTEASFSNRTSPSKELAVFDIHLVFLVETDKRPQHHDTRQDDDDVDDRLLLAEVRRLFVQTEGNLQGMFVIDLKTLFLEVLAVSSTDQTTDVTAGSVTAEHKPTTPPPPSLDKLPLPWDLDDNDESAVESIFLPVCVDQPYTQTCFPNALGHRSQLESSERGLAFLPLLYETCSEYMIRFWCLLFVPDCTNPGRRLVPCRSFCNVIRSECPDALPMLDNLTDSCNVLPESSDDCLLYPPDSQNSGCQEVEVTECRALGHSQTSFPNGVGHRGPHSAAEAWWKLAHIGSAVHCSEHLLTFGCSLVYPKCGDVPPPPTQSPDRRRHQAASATATAASSSSSGMIGPCRSLCEVVQSECGFFLKVAGLQTIAEVDCALLPQSSNPQICTGGNITGALQSKHECGDGEFACDDDSHACISAEWVCDGRWDCRNGSDERNCAVCQNGSQCNNGWCIEDTDVCNGVADCRDSEDERDCLKVKSSSDEHVTEGGGGDGVLEMYDATRRHSGGWTPVCLSTADWSRYAHMDLCTRRSFDLSSEIDDNYLETMAMLRNRSNCDLYEPLKISCNFSGCARPSPLLLRAAVASTEARLTDDFFIDAGDWPWGVSLHGGPRQLFFCGGSIIADNWLLTAAHCIGGLTEGDDWTVMTGHSRRHAYSATRQTRRVRHIVVHPEYSSSTMVNDIALIRVDRPFRFDSTVRRLCLPPLGYVPESGRRCYVGGWGKTSHEDVTYSVQARLRVLSVFPLSQCESFFTDVVADRLFCTAGRHGVDVCQGDSGSAVLCEATADDVSASSNPATSPAPGPGPLILAGIVSYGAESDCGNPAVPSVHTAVASFVPWIRDVIDGDVTSAAA
jgi:hypothetical protein